MTKINHHIPDDLLRDYAAGKLPHVFSVIVAAHVSICDDCRAGLEAADVLAGAMLDDTAPADLSEGALDRLMTALDTAPVAKPVRGSGIFPGPVMEALKGQPPKWKMIGGGVRQQILAADEEGSLRLLYIPPGRAVPEHGHGGLEMTLVLQGSFSDCAGRFARGDVETASDDLDHQPVAGMGEACICLAATDAPLRFTTLLPRLMQPFFRI